MSEEDKRLHLIRTNKAKEYFRQIKKYADAGSTATSHDELKASELCIYKLMNEIKKMID